MVLHFLINIATPPVVPNLQLAWKPSKQGADAKGAAEEEPTVDGYDVRFWRDEQEIDRLSRSGKLTTNQQPLGSLLRQFFEYFTVCGRHVIGQGFSWSTDVVSIRSKGGLLSKYSKGWTEAKTTFANSAQPGQGRKEVRHRYLFAIEDPFETEHNIARTVTHNGIVAIRDEFRRAWRIISTCGSGPNTQSIKEVFQPRTMPVPDSTVRKPVQAGTPGPAAQPTHAGGQ
jgi:terminal uridylyltransferase